MRGEFCCRASHWEVEDPGGRGARVEFHLNPLLRPLLRFAPVLLAFSSARLVVS